jgi:hypothetical protein
MKWLNAKVPSSIIMFFMLVPMCAFVLLCKLEAVNHVRSINAWDYEMQINMRVEHIALLRGRKIEKYREHVKKGSILIGKYKARNTYLEHKLNMADIDATQARQVVDVYRDEVTRLHKVLLDRRIESIDKRINDHENEPEKRHNKVPKEQVSEE